MILDPVPSDSLVDFKSPGPILTETGIAFRFLDPVSTGTEIGYRFLDQILNHAQPYGSNGVGLLILFIFGWMSLKLNKLRHEVM